MTICPLGNTPLKRSGFGLRSRDTPIVLGDAGALVEERLPILSGPIFVIGDQQGDDSLLIAP